MLQVVQYPFLYNEDHLQIPAVINKSAIILALGLRHIKSDLGDLFLLQQCGSCMWKCRQDLLTFKKHIKFHTSESSQGIRCQPQELNGQFSNTRPNVDLQGEPLLLLNLNHCCRTVKCVLIKFCI